MSETTIEAIELRGEQLESQGRVCVCECGPLLRLNILPSNHVCQSCQLYVTKAAWQNLCLKSSTSSTPAIGHIIVPPHPAVMFIKTLPGGQVWP